MARSNGLFSYKNGESVASNKSISPSPMDSKTLLDFYQKKLDEYELQEDKYKKKVDKHLEELISDRHKLEAEVLRRGEKISALQKALVDLQLNSINDRENLSKLLIENENLRENEVKLHEQIQQILTMTKENDLHDKIIYVLKNPPVEIGYSVATPKERDSSSLISSSDEKITSFLKDKLESLQKDLDDYGKISKTTSNVLIDDCKQALRRSKAKISADEEEIRKLQNKIKETERRLQESKTELDRIKDLHGNLTSSRSEPFLNSINDKISQTYQNIHHAASSTNLIQDAISKDDHHLSRTKSVDSLFPKHILSEFKDMHTDFLLLSNVLSRTDILITRIVNSQAYKYISKFLSIPTIYKDKSISQEVIDELKACIRDASRICFNLNSIKKQLTKLPLKRTEDLASLPALLLTEINDLGVLIGDMTVKTADADLIFMSLERAHFFQYLRGIQVPFQKFGVKESDQVTRYVQEFKTLSQAVEETKQIVTQGITFIKTLIEKYSLRTKFDILPSQSVSYNGLTSKSLSKPSVKFKSNANDKHTKLKSSISSSKDDLQYLADIYKKTIEEAKDLGLGNSPEIKSIMDKLKMTEELLQLENEEDTIKSMQQSIPLESLNRRQQSIFPSTDTQNIVKEIDKSLAKIRQIESGEYLQHDAVCAELEAKINALKEKIKELYSEINIQNLQDQFSSYSNLMLNKLEEITKSCRDAIITAEAEMHSQRTNAQEVSERLKSTEELLRESINEVLSLKQKLAEVQFQSEIDKESLVTELRKTLQSASDVEDVQTAVKEVVSSLDQHQTSSKTKLKPVERFGSTFREQYNKTYEEIITDLRQENRKLSTELKLIKKELKEEETVAKTSLKQVEKAEKELAIEKDVLGEKLQYLESRNASLLEQLKVEKNRIKNMERFRRLEIEGFQTDIKNLKSKIKDMEKQLMKAVLVFQQDKKDMELLQAVHTTARRSKQATNAIRHLKAKLYELETDIKHL